MWKEIPGFQPVSEEVSNPLNTLCFSWFFTYKAKDACYMGEKVSLRWVLLTCPWSNSFNYLWTCLLSVFSVLFFGLFWLFQKKKKIRKEQKYFILCLVLCFLRITWFMIFLSWFRTCMILWRNIESMCCIIECMSYFWFCISMY